ncbi:MAG: hypothetical protein GYB20_05740 [Oceanospirillales bacterium]|nr:hypothetical protein [Oceanospirillales bacterium]MBR9887182.1 hypothetical protein [Oceanospirillales bacterium]
MVNDDVTGVVEIRKEDIDKAIDAGKPIWINVAEQSMNQILFVQISATSSFPQTRPKIEGSRWN